MNLPKYRDTYLARNSQAYTLYTEWQKASSAAKASALKKLDAHMKEVDATFKKLHYP